MSIPSVDLSLIFTSTLSHINTTRDTATKQLTQLESQTGYGILLLKFLSIDTVPLDCRQAAAVAFKNYIMSKWSPISELNPADTNNPLITVPATDRELIKQHLVNLMLHSPPLIQTQLSHSLAIISSSDFPQYWPSLMPELVNKLQSNTADINVLIGILETAHSIFYRYRSELRSDPLWREINYVIEQFSNPLNQLIGQTIQFIQQAIQSASAAAAGNTATADSKSFNSLLKLLHLEYEIFYSLNVQDLPDYYLESIQLNMDRMNLLININIPNQLLNNNNNNTDDTEITPLDQIKSTICEILALYASRYEEQFQPYLSLFVSSIWQLLVGLAGTIQSRYDSIINTAIKFLNVIVKREWNKSLFQSENSLQSIAGAVIIPQLRLRPTDIELFEDDPVGFIRLDIEGSDVDTRRRTTVDFVRSLCIHFEGELSAILKSAVNSLITEYKSNPTANYLSKDTAIYIILALSARASTTAKGITQINPYVDLGTFFNESIIGELRSTNTAGNKDINSLPLIKADCLKFISTFRQQLPRQMYPELISLCSEYLTAKDYIVNTYAAHSIERLLTTISKPDANNTIAANNEILTRIEPLLSGLLVNLFRVLNSNRENEYLIRCLMRIIAVIPQSAIIQYAAEMIKQLTAILIDISINPRNPHFNHYLFESLAALIQSLCSTGNNINQYINQLESALFPPFQTLLGTESAPEFSPYIFQLMAQLLELRPNSTVNNTNTAISQAYQQFFSPLLAPVLWESQGNVPALIRLMKVYLNKGIYPLIASNPGQFEGLLGIFQKLLSSKKTELDSQELLLSIIQSVPTDPFIANNYNLLHQLISLIYSKLSSGKVSNRLFASIGLNLIELIRIYSFNIIQLITDKLQLNSFAIIFNKLLLPNLNYIQSDNQRQLVSIGLIEWVNNSIQLFIQNELYRNLISNIIYNAITLIQTNNSSNNNNTLSATIAAATAANNNNTNTIIDADEFNFNDQSFSTAYIKLIYAPVIEYNPLQSRFPNKTATLNHLINQIKQFLAQTATNLPRQYLTTNLTEAQSQTIQLFFQQNQITV